MGNIADRRARIKREREIAEKPGSVEDVSFAKLNKNLCNYPLARDQKGSSGWSATCSVRSTTSTLATPHSSPAWPGSCGATRRRLNSENGRLASFTGWKGFAAIASDTS
jgi:hypothetical protein